MRVKVRDIAKAAGVSPATVSNVFNNKNRISARTREHVYEVARSLGYEGAPEAQIKNGIRLIIFHKHGKVVMDTPFFSELIYSIETTCRNRNYELLISNIRLADPNAEKQIGELTGDESQAILLLATEMDEENLAPFLAAKPPLLILDSLFPCADVNTVSINNWEAGMKAARYLARMGHKNIGLINTSLPFNNMTERRKGFEESLRHLGIAFKERDLFPVEPTVEGAYSDMARLLEIREAPMPTALFATNDIMAIGAVRALKEKGFRLPDDISIIGMDDMPFCQILSPKLTTINVPKAGLGSTAVNRLINLIERRDPVVLKTQIGVDLTVRDSVRDLTK